MSRTATFSNSSRENYIKIKFDGCCKKNETACDWLLVKMAVGTLAVELKGCDVDHAVEQIEGAFSSVRASESLPQKLAALIVCTRYPKIDTKIQRYRQRLAKNFKGAPLHIKEDARNLQFQSLFKLAP